MTQAATSVGAAGSAVRRAMRRRRCRAEVTVRPSGHRFVVEGRESLLEAGLRGGLKLNYGCGDGSCGLCKARVVSGRIAPVGDERDGPLSAVEREQGYRLLCTHTAAGSDITVETLEAEGPQDIPMQRIACVVRGITPLTGDTLLLHLALPTTHRLRFLAGQRVTLAPSGAGADVHASYPVASCPCDDRNLHFYIARDMRDAFASRLFADGLRCGDPVVVAGPYGDFVLQDRTAQLVFVACDMGIAPIRSLIEHALAIDEAESLSLYWLVSRPSGHFLANQCRAWDEALDHFDYSLHRETDVQAGAAQVVDAIRVDRFPMQCDVYLAGPRGFVATAADALRAIGLPATQLHATIA